MVTFQALTGKVLLLHVCLYVLDAECLHIAHKSIFISPCVCVYLLVVNEGKVSTHANPE